MSLKPWTIYHESIRRPRIHVVKHCAWVCFQDVYNWCEGQSSHLPHTHCNRNSEACYLWMCRFFIITKRYWCLFYKWRWEVPLSCSSFMAVLSYNKKRSLTLAVGRGSSVVCPSVVALSILLGRCPLSVQILCTCAYQLDTHCCYWLAKQAFQSCLFEVGGSTTHLFSQTVLMWSLINT